MPEQEWVSFENRDKGQKYVWIKGSQQGDREALQGGFGRSKEIKERCETD